MCSGDASAALAYYLMDNGYEISYVTESWMEAKVVSLYKKESRAD